MENVKKLNKKKYFITKILLSTKLPNPILETRVSRMELGSFVDFNIFVKNIILFSFSYTPFFSNLSNQNLHKC